MDGPIDYLSGLGTLPDPIGAMEKQQAFKVNLAGQELQNQAQAAQTAAFAQKLNRAQQFQQDLSAVKQNPDAQTVSALMMKYPEFTDQIKAGWDVKDKAARDADLTQMGELYSAVLSGNWDLALKQAKARLASDQAAGQADPSDQAFVDQIEAASKGDPNAQKAVLATLGVHLAAVTGPEHFSSVFGALKGGYTLEAGATRYDENGNVQAESPFIKGADGTIYERDGANGSAAPSSAAAKPSTTPGGDAGFDPAVAFVLKHEGGYNPHDMNGAPVNMGINQAANPGVDVASLTPDEAKNIYKTKYWDQSGAANLPAAMQTPYFDTYVINPARAQQFLKASGGDPNKFMQLRETWLGTVAAKNPQYAKAYTTRNADLRLGLQGGASAASDSDSSADATAAPAGYHVLVPGNNSPDQYRNLTPAEVKQRGLDPSQQYQLNTKTGQLSGLGKIDPADQPIPGNANLSGPAYLATVPPNLATQVKALAEGRLPMPSSFALAKPYWQRLLQMTSQYDPTFDAANAPARKAAITAFTGNGKAAQTVGSVNRVANHLQLLWNESERLAGPELGNSVLNSVAAGIGQSFEPQDAKAYDTEVQFIAGELEKIARNSPGTVTGVNEIISNLSRKQSASTRASAIKAAVGIISGAIDPLKDQYNSAFTNGSTRPNIPWVTPRAQKIYRDIGGVDLSLTGAGADSNAPAAASAPVPVSSPAEAAKLPSGTLFKTPDGRILRKR